MKDLPHRLQVETLEDRVNPSPLAMGPSVPVPPPRPDVVIVDTPAAPAPGFITYGIGTSPSGPGR
jgi:hypothetical protein